MSHHIRKTAPEPQWSKDEKDTFVIRWKYITKLLKASGFDFSRVQIGKEKA